MGRGVITIRSLPPGSERVRCEGKAKRTFESDPQRGCLKRARWIVDVGDTDDLFQLKHYCDDCMGKAREADRVRESVALAQDTMNKLADD